MSHTLSHRILGTLSAGVLTFGLVACGSSSDDTSSASSQEQSQSQQQDQGQTGRTFPGANGEVVALDGSTAQVRSQMSGQVAVTWTGSTTFTQSVAGTISDIEVGDCVVAMSPEEGAAQSVSVTDAVDGECTSGPGGMGGRGDRPDGMPTDRPTDMPSDVPSDMPRPDDAGGRGNLVAGEVTAVSGDSLTVEAVVMGSDATESTTVMVADDTTVTTRADATSADVKVGVCVNAQGDRDDTGAVTATRVSVSDPVDGECGGFGGPGGGRGAAAEGTTDS